MNVVKYGLVAALVFLSNSVAYASGDYSILEGYPVGKCRLASNKADKKVSPLPKQENCTINVNYNYTGFADGFDLTPPIPYSSEAKTITYWVEHYSRSTRKWVKISPSRKILRNNITKQINFKPKYSGKYRVAFDFYGMMFADDYAAPFTLTLK